MTIAMAEIIEQASRLSAREQIEIAVRLLEIAKLHVSQPDAAVKPQHTQHKWAEIRGRYAGKLNGKDAQVWVNELRSEWDEREV